MCLIQNQRREDAMDLRIAGQLARRSENTIRESPSSTAQTLRHEFGAGRPAEILRLLGVTIAL